MALRFPRQDRDPAGSIKPEGDPGPYLFLPLVCTDGENKLWDLYHPSLATHFTVRLCSGWEFTLLCAENEFVMNPVRQYGFTEGTNEFMTSELQQELLPVSR